MYFPAPPPPRSAVEALLQQPFPDDWLKPLTHSAPSTVATTPAPKTPQRRRSSSSATSASGLAVPAGGPARATSAPPAAAASDVSQCSGVTKQGKRCGNKVKASLPLTYIDGAPEELERYCHVHLKESLAPSGFYSRKQKSVWVDFEDYIMEWLSADTKAALRAEMVKPASQSDADGYIYTFELRQPALSSDVHLKVGRTNNVTRRLHEWGKQCGKEVVPRGLWPAPEGDGASMLIGRIRPGPAGPFVNRLERLIHLELADLAVMAPYLPEDQRPKLPTRPQARRSSSDETGSKKSTASPARPSRPYVPCACGSLHKEIFVLPRAKSGKYKDHIWEDLVKSVIERWGNFVNDHVDLAQS
ncbi:hypothetical protein AURDEDRAFT_63622 [Auricularia subglabra TFB-10046 SS5]|nr:hypothetical protein AURDEDRAFT_63622 [Auricularia subglabra TFB-10046 SS5]